jgi:hypothetical protein
MGSVYFWAPAEGLSPQSMICWGQLCRDVAFLLDVAGGCLQLRMMLLAAHPIAARGVLHYVCRMCLPPRRPSLVVASPCSYASSSSLLTAAILSRRCCMRGQGFSGQLWCPVRGATGRSLAAAVLVGCCQPFVHKVYVIEQGAPLAVAPGQAGWEH